MCYLHMWMWRWWSSLCVFVREWQSCRITTRGEGRSVFCLTPSSHRIKVKREKVDKGKPRRGQSTPPRLYRFYEEAKARFFISWYAISPCSSLEFNTDRSSQGQRHRAKGSRQAREVSKWTVPFVWKQWWTANNAHSYVQQNHPQTSLSHQKRCREARLDDRDPFLSRNIVSQGPDSSSCLSFGAAAWEKKKKSI